MFLNSLGRFHQKLIEAFEKDDNESIVGIFNGCSVEEVQRAHNHRGSTLLHLAVEFDNEYIAKHLISLGLDVNAQDARLRTALMNALMKRNLSMAKTLLTASDLQDVKVCDAFGTSALRMAVTMDPPPELCAKDHVCPLHGWLQEHRQLMGAMLDRLEVQCSADSERMASELLAIHCPLMHVAMMSGSDVSCDTMRRMVEQGCAVDQTDFYFGLAALHVAVDQRRVDQVRVLLEAGADPHVQTYNRMTPLGYVYCEAGNRPRALPIDRETDLLRLLLRYESDWHKANSNQLKDELSALMLFGSKEALEVASHFNPNLLLLRSRGKILDCLLANRNPGVEQCIKYWLKDVNIRYGGLSAVTPIILAIARENHPMAECLLDEGARLWMANNYGVTAMHVPFVSPYKITQLGNYALSAEGSLQVLMLMLERGGDPQIRFPRHATFLDVALGNPQRYGHLAEVVLAQLAIRRALGKSISPIIRRQIQSHPKFDSHFDLCIYELAECELNVLYGVQVSVFDILVADPKCYALYARNRAVVARLSTIVIDQLELNVYYSYVLRKRFARILEIAALRGKVEMLVSQTIGVYYGDNHIVTQKIVDFLSDEEVRKLVCS